MKPNLYLTPLLLSLALFCGCSRSGQQHFTVSGTITGASGKVLYLDSEEAQPLDSVVLGQDALLLREGGAFLPDVLPPKARRGVHPLRC